MNYPLSPNPCLLSYDSSRRIEEHCGPGAKIGGADWVVGFVRNPAGEGVEDWILDARVVGGRRPRARRGFA